MHPDYEPLRAAPPAADYLRLRREAGLSTKTVAQARPALENSWAWTHVRHRGTGEVVAMGRVLGDGGWYFHVADMATLPAHQRRGLGRAVLEDLLERIRLRAPANPYVTLMADVPGRPLYRAAGFQDAMPGSMGMVLSPPTGPGAGPGVR